MIRRVAKQRFWGALWTFAVSAFGCSAALGGEADLVLRVENDFFRNVAVVAQSSQLPDAFSKLIVNRAVSCTSNNKVDFLVVLSKIPSAPFPVSDDDCGLSTATLKLRPHEGSPEMVAHLYLKSASSGADGGIVLALADVSVFDTATLPSADVARIQATELSYNSVSLPIQAGDASEQVTVSPKLNGGTILLNITHPALQHPLSAAILPGGIATENSGLAISTPSVRWVVSKFFANRTFPIRGTPFTFRNADYSTAPDEVKVSALVEDSTVHATFSAAVFWRGPELRLDQVQALSPRSCGGHDFLCQAKKTAENAAGSAIATVILNKYKGSRMLPNTFSEPIAFNLGGRKYGVELVSHANSATSDYLLVRGNIYLMVLP